jgi:hypothetical protein
VKVAFDSRPGALGHRAAHYARCLLDALRKTARDGDEIVETHRPRSAEVFHSPWFEGAMLHSPCPMVVTVHDVGALTRRSELLRGGGVHIPLRHLALQRATHVIVSSDAVAQQALAELGLEHERLVVIPHAVQAASSGDPLAGPPSAAADWTWHDVARATWRVYADALAQRGQPCVGRFSRRPAARTPRARMSGRGAGPPPDLPPSCSKA